MVRRVAAAKKPTKTAAGGRSKREPKRSPAGRPRDPLLEDRVRDVALKLYAEAGWSGFSFYAVAKLAKVGKAALYLRWGTPEALLIWALRQNLDQEPTLDTGSLRRDLILLTRYVYDSWSSPRGFASLRLVLEAGVHPALFAEYDEAVRSSAILAARKMVRRGIARGDLPGDTSPTLFLDALMGATLMHVLAIPIASRPLLEAQAAAYCERLVDFVLRVSQAR